MPVVPIQYTAGGTRAAAIYSGQVAPGLTAAPGAAAVGSDVILHSGPGRLVGAIPHQTYLTLSGHVSLKLYDGLPVSGGPLYASGHVLLADLGVAGGVSGAVSYAGQMIPLDVPFNSGLSLNSRSGQIGYTFVWVPEKRVQ